MASSAAPGASSLAWNNSSSVQDFFSAHWKLMLVAVVLAAAVYLYSMHRGGKLAPYVGGWAGQKGRADDEPGLDAIGVTRPAFFPIRPSQQRGSLTFRDEDGEGDDAPLRVAAYQDEEEADGIAAGAAGGPGQAPPDAALIPQFAPPPHAHAHAPPQPVAPPPMQAYGDSSYSPFP